MLKQSFIKASTPLSPDGTVFMRYLVSNEEYQAISTYLECTAGIDRKLAEMRLKIARTKANYSPKFEGDPDLPSDQYTTFVLSIEDSDYFDVACWLFIERRLRHQ